MTIVAIAAEILGHNLGQRSAVALIAIIFGLLLGLGALVPVLTDLRSWWLRALLCLAGSLLFLWIFGAGAMDDSVFCPTAPASECLGFVIGAAGACIPVAAILMVGATIAAAIRSVRRRRPPDNRVIAR